MSASRQPCQHWRRYRYSRRDPEGLYLVKIKHGAIFLGEFYCDEFVMAGGCYNQTPGMKKRITHIAKVEPP